jgi:hypothetical protein
VEAADALVDKLNDMAHEGNVTAAIFLLKGLRPDKYRDRSAVKVDWDGDYTKLTPEQMAKMEEKALDQLENERKLAELTAALPKSKADEDEPVTIRHVVRRHRHVGAGVPSVVTSPRRSFDAGDLATTETGATDKAMTLIDKGKKPRAICRYRWTEWRRFDGVPPFRALRRRAQAFH